MERSSGVLMHLSSLSSDYGIGMLGQCAFDFVDFLNEAGVKMWQMLPVCPVDEHASPYQSYSTFAGNYLFIDLVELEQEGLISKADLQVLIKDSDDGKVDFDFVMMTKKQLLNKAFTNWLNKNSEDVLWSFTKEHDWVLNYALFMVLLKKFKTVWWNWPEEFKFRRKEDMEKFKQNSSQDILFYVFEQFIFYRQWFELKDYANKKGVSLVGDIPIYVSGNSADVWANPENFCLDENLMPKKVAGCPPDAFSVDGQLWGNPIYDWSKIAATNYFWWIQRLKSSCDMFDLVRIDHFRGFESFYAIDAGKKTAREGVWLKGPGMDFFNEVEKQLGKLNLIAEDLGFLTDKTRKLLTDSGFPGMKILQFAFDVREKSDYLPHNYIHNSVCYTGTHDNNTIVGWFKEIDEPSRAYCRKYLQILKDDEVNWNFIRAAMASVCNLAVIPVQDFLGLDESCRMNKPGTINGNWQWRLTKAQFKKLKDLAVRIKDMVQLYGR